MTHRLVKWGAFLVELCLLLMLYTATLLAPIEFGFIRIGIALVLLIASCGLAYLASFRLDRPAEINHYSFKQVIVKPPFVVWIVVVSIILLELANGLVMTYLANKR